MRRAFFLRMLLLALILTVGLPVVSSQETEQASESILTLIQTAETGGFTLDENGTTYTLTLNDISEITPYLIETDALDFDSGELATAQMAEAWAVDETLIISEVLLQTETASVVLTLSAPVYAEGTLTYTAEVQSVINTDASTDVPESFEAATLFITATGEFWQGLSEGYESLGLRGRSCRRCNPSPQINVTNGRRPGGSTGSSSSSTDSNTEDEDNKSDDN